MEEYLSFKSRRIKKKKLVELYKYLICYRRVQFAPEVGQEYKMENGPAGRG